MQNALRLKPCRTQKEYPPSGPIHLSSAPLALQQDAAAVLERRPPPHVNLSPEQLRAMLIQAFADPQTALLLRRALTGPLLPFAAGTCTAGPLTTDAASTNGKIPKFVDVTNNNCTFGNSS